MPEFHRWSNIKQAWAATEHCPVASINDTVSAAPKHNNDWTLIKREARVRLLVIDSDSSQHRVICKIYRIPAHLGWRTLGMVSRGNREFTALMEAHRKGLPVACPYSWQEARTLGCVSHSSVSLELISGINLEDALADESIQQDKRLQLAWKKGVLLRKLHKSGLQWGTAFPRNIMLEGDLQSAADSVQMRVIDTPYALFCDADISGKNEALIDLRNATKVNKSGVGFGELERTQFLLGYCGDDLHDYSGLLEQLAPRPNYQLKLARWRQRCANVISHSPRSAGSGGSYSPTTGRYRRDP